MQGESAGKATLHCNDATNLQACVLLLLLLLLWRRRLLLRGLLLRGLLLSLRMWDVDVMHDISFALTPPCSHYPSRWCQCDAIKSGYSTQTEGGGLSITWTLCGARIT